MGAAFSLEQIQEAFDTLATLTADLKTQIILHTNDRP